MNDVVVVVVVANVFCTENSFRGGQAGVRSMSWVGVGVLVGWGVKRWWWWTMIWQMGRQ